MKSKISVFLKKKLKCFFLDCLLFQTSFFILFPKYKEKHIQEIWNVIERISNSRGLKSFLSIKLGFMKVETGTRMSDPFLLFKGKDFLKLISRSFPAWQAAKIFDQGIFCDIIKISKAVSDRRSFLKRRKRLIGNNGVTVKAIEFVTQSYILIQGGTVCCMSSHLGLKKTRKIVEDCMHNIHPVINVKFLVLKKVFLKNTIFKIQRREAPHLSFPRSPFPTSGSPMGNQNIKYKNVPHFLFLNEERQLWGFSEEREGERGTELTKGSKNFTLSAEKQKFKFLFEKKNRDLFYFDEFYCLTSRKLSTKNIEQKKMSFVKSCLAFFHEKKPRALITLKV